MKKVLTLAATIIAFFMTNGAFASIYPWPSTCVGTSTTLFDSSSSGVSSGGIWSSSNTSVATIGSSSGIMTAISPGTSIISYVGTTTSTAICTVYPMPAAITGGSSPFCVGATTALSCATSGGSWVSYSTYYASVSSTTGVVTGINPGTATIGYVIGSGCATTTVVTVSGATGDSVSGPGSVCVGSTITYSTTATGGTWSSSFPANATVSSTGVVTGVSAGYSIITYAVPTSCGTAYLTHYVSVTSTTSPGTLSGGGTVAVGTGISIYATVSGGTWSSSSTSIATVSSGGYVTGIAPGTATITYTITGCSGPASVTTIVTVISANCISGDVQFTGVAYYGGVKVWLIKYNPTTHILSAVDSTTVYASGTAAHYAFCGLATDSFRVKAACDSMVSTPATGYTPTYHTASVYWSGANVIYHISGTDDINKNITMGYGTVTSGPGFVGGDVTTGANKGTAGGVPAVGLLIYCVNNATGTLIQQTYTDATGHYSFSSLPVDVALKIYPEAMNYVTTPYPPITLTSGSPSMTLASFEQHTISYTITPIVVAVGNVTAENAAISIFPNPTNGTLNIKWEAANSGNGSVVITDITGRQVLSTTIDMNNGAGSSSLNLAGFSKGLYMVSIKGSGINYNTKIELQ